MKMNKMFTGLIALVAGVALSAGSAFATKGYAVGDFARMKLVPWFETGPMKATIIGVQNLSSQEAVTEARKAAAKAAADDLETKMMDTTLAGGLITALEMDAAAAAMAADYSEHLFVTVAVHDEMGMMMGEAVLCLSEHQFGYVVLQGPSDMGTDSWQGVVLSEMDGDIPPYGYVTVTAEDKKFQSCEGDPREGLTGVNTGTPEATTAVRTDPAATDGGFVVNVTDANSSFVGAKSMVAAWTIIQDVGDGFFGTEVPTSTMTTMAARDDMTTADVDESTKIDCYAANDNNGDGDMDDAGETAGPFKMQRCGLIPERHNNNRITAEGPTMGDPNIDGANATPRANVITRYDAGDESMIYVWLAEGMDAEDALPTERRMLEAVVKCEDGTVVMANDLDGMPTQYIKIPAPTMITMIDPNGDALGEYTGMCAGDRGVVKIVMPGKSHAGMVFTHITQMMGHYRMNFLGHSMADPTACAATGEERNCADKM